MLFIGFFSCRDCNADIMTVFELTLFTWDLVIKKQSVFVFTWDLVMKNESVFVFADILNSVNKVRDFLAYTRRNKTDKSTVDT